MDPAYRDWLAARGLKPSSVSSHISYARRLEKHYGDLDELYDQDRLAGTLNTLQYSKDDEKRNRPNPSKLKFDGDLNENLAYFRSSLKRYRDFRAATGEPTSSQGTWDEYLRRAEQVFTDGALDRDEGYKSDLADAVSAAKSSLLTNSEDWPQLLTDAISHRKNNLIDGRAYAEGKESNQGRFVRWVDRHSSDVRRALLETWADDDRTPGDRILALDEALPDDMFGKGARSARLDVASYLMMGLDADQFPPYRRSKFEKTYTWLGYPQPPTDGIGAEYEHALRFLDDLQAEARKRGMDRPNTRLDAQSVVWSLSYQLADPASKGDAEPPVGESEQPTSPSHALNAILYGPSGTGKTYTTVRRCVEICDGQAPEGGEELRARHGALMDAGRVEFVTFHQSYGYEEFVEGLRPRTSEAGGMHLAEVDGVLKRMAERARNLGNPRPHVLVIDEINRANVSKVMGELITLLEDDKREGAENEVAVTLPYSGDRFTLPANLHILGTMNTADRSIALLDTALRRRFHFEEVAPAPTLLAEAGRRTGVDLPRVLGAMNERLEYLVDRDHLIGHAWFMAAETRDDVDIAMRRKIIPLIAEYFYDDWSKVRAVLGGTDAFVDRQRLSLPPGIESDLGEDRYRWTVRDAFPQGAYDHLVGQEVRGESVE